MNDEIIIGCIGGLACLNATYIAEKEKMNMTKRLVFIGGVTCGGMATMYGILSYPEARNIVLTISVGMFLSSIVR